MLGSAKAALAAVATSIKSALPAVVAATTATVLAGGCIYYYTIKDGIYEKSASNFRYVLEQYISQISVNSIVDNGRGGYAYTTNLDEMADEILRKLKEANSSISSYTGNGNEKEVITKLIKAEIITQYPDLRSENEIKNSTEIPENEVQGGIKIVRSNSSVEVSEVDTENIPEYDLKNKKILTYKPYHEFKQLIQNADTSVTNYYSLKSSSVSSSVEGNFVVKTDETNSAPVLTKQQIESAILNTYEGEAESNLIGALDAFMKIQEEQKVNAIFAIAVTQEESSCGTNWSQIDSSSNNWMRVKSSSDVTGWEQYDSFSHATEKFGDLISESQYYFKANKYSVNDIGPVYCDAEWANSVNEFMAKLYNSVGIQIDVSNQVTTTKQSTATNSVDIVVAGWSTERTEVKTLEYAKNNTGTQEIKVKNDKTDTGDIYTFYEVSINYQNMLSRYSMPAGFLWSLLVMGEDPQFTLKLADLAINDTNIVIEAQDSNSITVNEDIQKYILKKDVTKKIVTEDSNEKTKDYTYQADTESSVTTTITTKYSNTRLNLVYAKTWVATYKANYKNIVNSADGIDRNWYKNTEWQDLEDVNLGTIHSVSNNPNIDNDYSDIKQELINSITMEQCRAKLTSVINEIKNNNTDLYDLLQSTADSNVQIILNNIGIYIYNHVKGLSTQTAINNINNAIDILWDSDGSTYSANEAKSSMVGALNSIASKMKTLKKAEMDITEYKVQNKFASNIQTVNTNTYVSAGTVVKERTDIDEENNFVEYFNKSKRAKEYILGTPSWLYEMLESQEKTANMIDLFKYLLYKSTDTNYGVTTFDFKVLSTTMNNMSYATSGSGFWWPIGSDETEQINGILFAKGNPPYTRITSGVGPRWGKKHGGIDIANGTGKYSPGSHVIAAASGVVTVSQDCYSNNGYYGSKDGGGWGNHVIIDHGNGYKTIYAHMYPNTITVRSGDVVEQGQVIGKIGNSGSSTGGHLHFEVRLNNERVDPEEYVDPDNPRPQGIGVISQELYNFISAFEGGTQYYNSADRTYTVFNNGLDSNLELTCGIAIGTTNGGLYSYAQNILNRPITIGSKITEDEYNQILTKVLEQKMSTVDSAIAATGVTLTQQQKDALFSLCYNVSNAPKRTKEALEAFKNSGNKGYWKYIRNITNNGLTGLVRRRTEEFEMFLEGEYIPAENSEAMAKYRNYNAEYGQ